jgi:hypothetical protein
VEHALGGPPHEGFSANAQPNQWYEDRDQLDTRYSRRTGPHVDQNSDGTWPYYNNYHGNGYTGTDQPSGFPPGVVLRFRLIVVDVCNGGKTIYTSKTINVAF